MAKGKGKKKRGGKKARSRKGTKAAAAGRAKRAATGTRRAKLHAAAALLSDFHGGKLPVLSGCGRPRKRR